MKYVRGFRQETVKADSPEVFDLKMNDIFCGRNMFYDRYRKLFYVLDILKGI